MKNVKIEVKKLTLLLVMANMTETVGTDEFNEAIEYCNECLNQIEDEGTNETLTERIICNFNLELESLETANQLP